MYVSCAVDHKILKLDRDGQKVIEWGQKGRAPGQFESPHGVLVDGDGNVVVADTGNHRIQVFTTSGEFVRQWGAYGGQNGFLRQPCGITMDSAGRIWVADFGNNRLQQFDPNGRWLKTLGHKGLKPAEFQGPTDVSIDQAGHLLISDALNQRIQKLNGDGSFVCEWGGRGNVPGSFNYPHSVAVDAQGSVYVADLRNNRLQKFTAGSASSQNGVSAKRALPGAIAANLTNQATGRVYCLLERSTPSQAKLAAERLGGRLAVLRSASEAHWLWTNFANFDNAPRNLIIGLQREDSPSFSSMTHEERGATFHWNSGEPTVYVNWAEHEPNNFQNGNERFVCLLPPGSVQPAAWNDCGDVDTLYGAPMHGLVDLGSSLIGPSVTAGPIINPANGHLYYLLEQSTQPLAKISAEKLGGFLVTINNAAEQRWVFEMFGTWGSIPRHLWIGLEHPDPANGSTNKVELRREFRWHSGQALTYMNWSPKEPNRFEGIPEGFVHFWAPEVAEGNGLWNDVGFIEALFGAPAHGVVEIER